MFHVLMYFIGVPSLWFMVEAYNVIRENIVWIAIIYFAVLATGLKQRTRCNTIRVSA